MEDHYDFPKGCAASFPGPMQYSACRYIWMRRWRNNLPQRRTPRAWNCPIWWTICTGARSILS